MSDASRRRRFGHPLLLTLDPESKLPGDDWYDDGVDGIMRLFGESSELPYCSTGVDGIFWTWKLNILGIFN